MSNAQVYADLFDLVTKLTLGAAQKIPEANRLRTVQEGKAHPLWLIGHLANSNSLMVLKFCCGQKSPLPREYNKTFAPDFAQGDPIVTDPAAYPDWDEVVANYKLINEACAAGIRNLSDEDLGKELEGAPDMLKHIFGNVDYTIRHMIAHDSHHRGQMAMLGALS